MVGYPRFSEMNSSPRNVSSFLPDVYRYDLVFSIIALLLLINTKLRLLERLLHNPPFLITWRDSEMNPCTNSSKSNIQKDAFMKISLLNISLSVNSDHQLFPVIKETPFLSKTSEIMAVFYFPQGSNVGEVSICTFLRDANALSLLKVFEFEIL